MDALFHTKEQEFLLKWMAWLVQKPGVLPGVCIVITGKQGCGKSTIFEKLFSHMLGSYYGTTNNPKNDLFGTFVELKNGKRMVVINDCPVSQVKSGAEQFKSLITDEIMNYERKGHQSIPMHNITSYVMVTNSDEPVRLEASDRRYMIAECKPDLIGKFEYFKALHSYLDDPKNIRAIYEFLMGYDISMVTNLARDRPITQAYKDNKMISADKELHFLASIVIPSLPKPQMKTNVIYLQFKKWAIEYGGVSDEKFLSNIMSFSRYINKIPGVIFSSDRKHGSKIEFDKNLLSKHLLGCGLDIDGVCAIVDDEVSTDY
jgi:energy-coupling factor transporter ATP-binding protein EcfA2